MFKPIKFWTLIVLSFLTSCASQQWVPPDTPRGRFCVEECKMARERCSGVQQMAIANCANSVQTELHAYNDPNMYAEMACADGMYDGHAGTLCQRDYRLCFIGCGGTFR